MITNIENKILNNLTKAVIEFRKLEITHPSHEKEFIDGIHKCQEVIMWRIVQRDYPKIFPMKGKK